MTRHRDRHGRGRRGPMAVPTDPKVPTLRTRRERFDDIALAIVSDIDARWQSRLGLIEYAVEESPDIPKEWTVEDHIPLGSLERGSGATPARLVVYRRPIEHRCQTRAEVEAMVLMVVVEQVADLLGIAAEDVHPRYQP
ncbi:metallopeptidase family protein [Nocardioides panzhihuensis]|uniref:Putative Zn-dependent protease with MMP-like domain n=1 Tax=Nocardioides panzhihuensis TaxID=860243 RepID=A0A7Z0DPY6_9ACTN|nr:metallopeptidase family protein [Nocardioides panzhihuensis]NYI79231.1 putative Zn-dependent protease with MMP-like domain [Nocardioides panzhihuensis]